MTRYEKIEHCESEFKAVEEYLRSNSLPAFVWNLIVAQREIIQEMKEK